MHKLSVSFMYNRSAQISEAEAHAMGWVGCIVGRLSNDAHLKGICTVV